MGSGAWAALAFGPALVLAALAYLWLGSAGRNHLLQNNPCNMTYTTMAKSAVKVESAIVGPKLFVHPSSHAGASAKGQPPSLNPQPVLFIPGNRGT